MIISSLASLDNVKVVDVVHISELDNKCIHNFSLGCLDAYFELNEAIAKGCAVLINSRILVIEKRKPKVYVFTHYVEDAPLLTWLQKYSVVYSLDKIDCLTKESKFKEVVYDLEKVFSGESYLTAKKRHQRIVYPFNWLKKNQVIVTEMVADDLEEVVELHKEWVDYKLADEKTFKMMFPTGRYLRCCKHVVPVETEQPVFFDNLVSDVAIKVDYRGYVARMDGKVVSVRIIAVQGKAAYDLAFFTNTWTAPSQLSNYLDVCILKELYNGGVRLFNCGAALHSRLKVFKTHLPSFEVVSYMYSKLKEE